MANTRPIPTLTDDDRKRFYSKCDYQMSSTSCVNWLGGKDKDGYGKFTIGNRTYRAHRVALFIAKRLDSDLQVNHLCGNKSCVRADHLELVTPQENTLFALYNGDTNTILTIADVENIKTRAFNGESDESLAILYGTSKATIADIRLGKSWKRILPEMTRRLNRPKGQGTVFYYNSRRKWGARFTTKHIGYYNTKELAEQALLDYKASLA